MAKTSKIAKNNRRKVLVERYAERRAELVKVLKDPEPVVRLHTLGDSSMDFIVRPWSKTSDYWDVYWDVTREVKRRFDEEGISIPFPQRDVHIYQQEVSGDGGDASDVQHSDTETSAQTPIPVDEKDV